MSTFWGIVLAVAVGGVLAVMFSLLLASLASVW